eukprot:4523322-Prorocentrum_lima.AAC.1
MSYVESLFDSIVRRDLRRGQQMDTINKLLHSVISKQDKLQELLQGLSLSQPQMGSGVNIALSSSSTPIIQIPRHVVPVKNVVAYVDHRKCMGPCEHCETLAKAVAALNREEGEVSPEGYVEEVLSQLHTSLYEIGSPFVGHLLHRMFALTPGPEIDMRPAEGQDMLTTLPEALKGAFMQFQPVSMGEASYMELLEFSVQQGDFDLAPSSSSS